MPVNIGLEKTIKSELKNLHFKNYKVYVWVITLRLDFKNLYKKG